MIRPFELVGHRGARGLLPENTLAGFAGAIAIGVDTIELDVALTADDVVVVTHDPLLNPALTRTGGGNWLTEPGPPIRSLRAAELASYDVGRLRPGSDYADLYPEQSARDGARIPSLAEALGLDDRVNFIVEVKTFPDRPGLATDAVRMTEAVVGVVDAAAATGRITMESFDWRGPRCVRRRRPGIRVAWLTRASILQEARLWWDGPHPSDYGGSVPRAVAAEGGPTWGPDFRDLTQQDLAEAHALGLRVVPWTVNATADMRRLIGWGVDGIVTDRPDLARTVLAEEGYEPPPPRVVRAG